MKRIPLPAVIIIALAAVALTFIVWSAAAEPDATPPTVPTLTAPAPAEDSYPAPYPGPYPGPDAYPAPGVYLPAVLELESYP